MSDGINKVFLAGNLVADPEFKATSGGGVLRLRMATNESYLDKSNVRQEKTEFHNVMIWGKRGEALSSMLTKGQKVFVEGSLRTSSYEKNGEKRYKTEIVANNIVLTGGAASGGGERQGRLPAQLPGGPEVITPYEDDSDLPF